MTLGERLLGYRTNAKMSQDTLAEKIGVTRQTISKWETDQSTPEFNKILPLCEIYGITTDELIKGEKQEKEDVEKEKMERSKEIEEELFNRGIQINKKIQNRVIEIIALIFLTIYLTVSFLTKAWNVTWILWIVFALVETIVKLIFDLKKGENNGK